MDTSDVRLNTNCWRVASFYIIVMSVHFVSVSLLPNSIFVMTGKGVEKHLNCRLPLVHFSFSHSLLPVLRPVPDSVLCYKPLFWLITCAYTCEQTRTHTQTQLQTRLGHLALNVQVCKGITVSFISVHLCLFTHMRTNTHTHTHSKDKASKGSIHFLFNYSDFACRVSSVIALGLLWIWGGGGVWYLFLPYWAFRCIPRIWCSSIKAQIKKPRLSFIMWSSRILGERKRD